MQAGWRVGSLFGIPLYIDPSWLFVVVLITIADGSLWQRTHPEWGITAWMAGFAMALLLFGSFLLHELAHGLVAKANGMEVESITLSFFGGMTSSKQEAKTAGQAFQVAIAGPVMTFAVVVLLVVGIMLLPDQDLPAKVVMQRLAELNFLLVLLNLLPAMPLDGGQIVKAIVWKVTKSQFQATRWTAKVSKTVGGLAIALGVLAGLTGKGLVPSLLVSMIGWIMVQNATAYDRLTDVQEALLKLKAESAMTRDFRVVDGEMTLRQFADDYVLDLSHPSAFFAASKGRYQGLVVVSHLHEIERSEWEQQSLLRIVQPLTEIPAVQEATSLVAVIQKLEAEQLPRITVLSPAGAVAGIIDRGDIVQALSKKMNLMIADDVIKQIKAEGVYPPGLPLATIAQSAHALE
jgi:Zn-dependent protease